MSKVKILARAPKLKWIQRMGTVVNSVLTDDIVNNPVIVTKFCHTKE
jgi:phosphoglycerate dehydrogenase-like enzyme